MTDLLTLRAADVRPHDSVAEGSRVTSVVFRNAERWDLLGGIYRIYEVEVVSVPARWVCLGEINDTCIHCGDDSTRIATTYDATDEVRVLRPAPMSPAPCGYTGSPQDA